MDIEQGGDRVFLASRAGVLHSFDARLFTVNKTVPVLQWTMPDPANRPEFHLLNE